MKQKKIYVIAILKDSCIYCKEFKNMYWNDSSTSWKNIVSDDFGFVPWTINIDHTNEAEIKKHLINNGVDYITTYPFIMAAEEGKYNVDEVFVFCSKLINGKYVYDDTLSPCRTLQNFVNWLTNVRNYL